eukprot:scaffold12365_cov19-Tisochrysis_lutea.AAC.2
MTLSNGSMKVLDVDAVEMEAQKTNKTCAIACARHAGICHQRQIRAGQAAEGYMQYVLLI